ncbi:hypothetical protein CQA66_04835 [Helicobacter aurati]|uniref:Beta-lactamase n=1 Tax=Helicobacter aurati TaxID=137778 RepID=A0A3D8J6E5_9HELI|nr:SEL1-like repeat protein [Helicobacter aurati]RDU72391.1 hypothetical protein CQA66_04835 [Helicobacter aurati]
MWLKRLLLLFCCVLPIYVCAQDSLKFTTVSSLDGDFLVWHKQCKQKDYQACYFLGLSFMQGYKTLPDIQKGNKTLLMACQNRILESCLALQQYYPLDSDSILLATMQPTWNSAFLAYKEACDLEDIESCETLAKFLLQHKQTLINKESTEQYQPVYAQILNVLDNFCNAQAEDSLNNSTCQTLENFKLIFYNVNTSQIPALLISCKKSLQTPYAARTDCARLANAYARGDNVSQDKMKAYEYFSLACQRHKRFCYNKVLDSILSKE